MSAATTKTALQALHRAVSGVQTAPDAYPASIETADLPCVLTYIGAGVTRWDDHGGSMKRRERTIQVRWYVSSINLGVGPDEGMQQAIDLLDAAIALYEDTDDLSNGAQIHLSESDAQAIRDTGVVSNLSYGEAVFRGFDVQLSVWEWVS